MTTFLYLQAYPIIHALMERKTITSYLAVLKEFVNVCNERQIVVEKVVSDFEAAIRSVVETLMPETIIVGCYFHFARAVYMRFKKMGLVRNPTEQKTSASKMAMCLSLLPANQINSGIAIIRGKLPIYFIRLLLTLLLSNFIFFQAKCRMMLYSASSVTT